MLKLGDGKLKVRSDSPMHGITVVTPGLISWTLMMVRNIFCFPYSHVEIIFLAQVYFTISPDTELTSVGGITGIPYEKNFDLYKQMIITKKDTPTMKRVLHLFQSKLFPDAITDENDEVFNFDNPGADSQDELGELMRALDDLELAPAHFTEGAVSTANEVHQPDESPDAAMANESPDAVTANVPTAPNSITGPSLVTLSTTPRPLARTPIGAVLPAGTTPDAFSRASAQLRASELPAAEDAVGRRGRGRGRGNGQSRRAKGSATCGATTSRTTRAQAMATNISADIGVDDELDEEITG